VFALVPDAFGSSGSYVPDGRLAASSCSRNTARPRATPAGPTHRSRQFRRGLAVSQGRVADGVFDVMKEHLSDKEILEFTFITATYVMHATMSKALRLEYDDVDDSIVEIDTPDLGKTGLDVMAMTDTSITASEEPK
jgi:hypothetical protein